MQYQVSIDNQFFDVTVQDVSETAPIQLAPPMAAAPVAVAAAPVRQQAAPASTNLPEEQVESPISGRVCGIKAKIGQWVEIGEAIIVLEAEKKQAEVVAPRAGCVKQVLVNKGTAVETGDVLVVLKKG